MVVAQRVSSPGRAGRHEKTRVRLGVSPAPVGSNGPVISTESMRGTPSESTESVVPSSGRSNASENLIGQRVLTREFPVTFGLGLLAKDAGIAADVVRVAGASAPVLMQTEALFRAAATVIGAGQDHTAALRLIEQMNDKEIR